MKARKILVGLDNVPTTGSALDFALKYFNNKGHLLVGLDIEASKSTPKLVSDRSDQLLKRSTIASARLSELGTADPKSALVRETRFADLLLLAAGSYFKVADKPNWLAACLSEAKCPVLLVPDDFNTIRNIILTYDGRPESVYAIKQFCYLFSGVCDQLEVTLLTVIDEDSDFDIDSNDERLLVEYLRQHCPNLGAYKMIGETQQTVLHTVDYSPQSLVVMGGLGAGAVSMMFYGTSVGQVLNSDISSAFIAH